MTDPSFKFEKKKWKKNKRKSKKVIENIIKHQREKIKLYENTGNFSLKNPRILEEKLKLFFKDSVIDR